jgi:hypothetical protein
MNFNHKHSFADRLKKAPIIGGCLFFAINIGIGGCSSVNSPPVDKTGGAKVDIAPAVSAEKAKENNDLERLAHVGATPRTKCRQ